MIFGFSGDTHHARCRIPVGGKTGTGDIPQADTRSCRSGFDSAVAAIILVLVLIESLMLVKLNYSTDLSNESRVTDRDSNALQHARSFQYFSILPIANQKSNFIPCQSATWGLRVFCFSQCDRQKADADELFP
jgi:hypothetical protein